MRSARPACFVERDHHVGAEYDRNGGRRPDGGGYAANRSPRPGLLPAATPPRHRADGRCANADERYRRRLRDHLNCVGVLRCREHDQDRQSENAHEVLSVPRDGGKRRRPARPAARRWATQLLRETPPAERAEDDRPDTEQRQARRLRDLRQRQVELPVRPIGEVRTLRACGVGGDEQMVTRCRRRAGRSSPDSEGYQTWATGRGWSPPVPSTGTWPPIRRRQRVR